MDKMGKKWMIHLRALGPEIFLDPYPFKIGMSFYFERLVYFENKKPRVKFSNTD